MTITIDLSPSEEAQFTQEAQRSGMAPAALVQRLVTQHLSLKSTPEDDPTLRLFAQWGQEDAHMTPEEVGNEQLLWSEFQRGTNDTRRKLGMRTL